jgi:hypothetical protein
MASSHHFLGKAYTPSKYFAYLDDEACYVNLLGDYGYMTSVWAKWRSGWAIASMCSSERLCTRSPNTRPY